MSNFQDIKIVGLDDEASKPHHGLGRDRRGLSDIELILSDSAPYEWAEYFNEVWKHKIYMVKRRASVSGDRLTITCVPEELEKDHLPELKKLIDETNQKYKEYSAKQQAEEEWRKQVEDGEKEKLRNLKNSIKFD